MTAEGLEGIDVVIAEIYPSLVKAKAEKGETLDEVQVREIARHYSQLDEKGLLGAAFSTGKSLDAGKIEQIQAEEGWILGT